MRITKEIKELVTIKISSYYEVKKDKIRKQQNDEYADRKSKYYEIGQEYDRLVAANIPALVELITEEILKKYSGFVNEKNLNKTIKKYLNYRELDDYSYFTESFVKGSECGERQRFNKILEALEIEKNIIISETLVALQFGDTKEDLDKILEKFTVVAEVK